ncbi:MAG: hypothetical protein GY856_43605 [bacterium]|nr:hypothetical protein [bacterium]
MSRCELKRTVAILVTLVLAATLASAQALDPRGIQDLIDSTGGEARVRVDPLTGAARFVTMPPGSLTLGLAPTAPAQERAEAFFREYGSIFGMTRVESELQPAGTSRDGLGGEHAVFQQNYGGVPVFGAELRAHFRGGELTVVNGTFLPGLKLDTVPHLSAGEAAALAVRTVIRQQDHRKQVDQQGGLREEDYLQELTAVSSTLTVFRAGLLQGVPGRDHLVYEVEVANAAVTIRELVYVDAHTGKVVDQITGIHHALDRKVSETSLANVIWQDSAGDPDPIPAGWAGGTAQQVTDWQNEIDGAREIYNLIASMNAGTYLSYDGADATMRTVNNDPGIFCPNAMWNGTSTNYCSGVTADDTVAHEWGHAYMQFTANLIYQWQPGALDEAYADIWGDAVDLLNGRGTDSPGGLRSTGGCSVYGSGSPSVDNSYRWLSGEDDPAIGGAIRDLWNPNCYGDPGKVTDTQYWCTSGDGGGVHTNSGVPNHAFALIVDGGTYNGYTITGLGLTKAAHIQWAAQNLLTAASNFVDQADALEAACTSLIGVNLPALSTSVTNAGPSGISIIAVDCTEVATVNDAVELRTAPSQCNFNTVLDPDAPPLCEGQGSVQTASFEDFEGGTLPAGWTVSSHDVANPATFDNPGWVVVGSLPAGSGGSYAPFVPDLDQGDCGADDETGALSLDGPAITLPAGVPPHVAFDHWVATEAGYDGGNLKVSVNGGPWTLVPGSAYAFNAYTDTLAAPPGNTNPLAGEEAFTGADEGSFGGSWGQSQVDLIGLAAPGDSVRLRFDLGVDGCFGLIGWYVDDVRVYGCTDEPLPICGDGQLDPGEACDDGNGDSGDGCSDTCQVEDGWVCTDPTTDLGNLTLSEGFEGGAIPPAGWTTQIQNRGYTWQLHTLAPNTGAYATDVEYDPYLVPQDEWLISPAFTPAADSLLAYATNGSVYWCRDTYDNCDVEVWLVVGAVGGGDDVFVGRADDFWPSSYTWTDALVDLAPLLPGGPVRLAYRYVGVDGAQSVIDDVKVGQIVSTPSICWEIVEELACNAGTVEFDDGLPSVWTTIDNIGFGLIWSNIAGAGEIGNYTGGTGDAATASSDAFGPADFDTELRSNVFSLANAASASLDYLVNYQNFAAFDVLDVDVSTDGGSNWTNLLSWNEDHGGFRGAPGEAVSLDLAAYLGSSDVQLRWRYYDPTTYDWDWYAQVDNVSLTCNLKPDCDAATASPDTLWPPNHQFQAITVNVSDPDGDPVTVTIDSIYQDEAVDAKGSGNTSPDGQGVGTSTAEVRAERSGKGDGRVYHIYFTADDGRGGTCSGEVLVGVPHDQGGGGAIDGGPLYDSTATP